SGQSDPQREYWQNRFHSPLPVLNLPIDFPRPDMQSFEGNLASFVIHQPETRLLKKIAKEENTTLFTLLLTMYKILLVKISGQDRVIVGTPSAGRTHTDLQHIIGIFLNTLAIKTPAVGEYTVRGFLREVRNAALEAFDNQDFQFEDLVEYLGGNTDTRRNPVFDVMFIFQNMEFPHFDVPGLRVAPYPWHKKTSMMDITLIGEESGDQLNFTLEYCSRLFKEETVSRIIDIYCRII
ncbi:MAG: hypothetical protein GY940_02725, partial [bacterium]|nr:hypothetical protein [bacterium]